MIIMTTLIVSALLSVQYAVGGQLRFDLTRFEGVTAYQGDGRVGEYVSQV